MLDALINLLDNTPLYSAWGRLAVVASLFVAAWLLSRASAAAMRSISAFAALRLTWGFRRP